MQDDVVDEFANKLSVIKIVLLLLLGCVNQVVIHNSRSQMKLGLHNLNVFGYIDELLQAISLGGSVLKLTIGNGVPKVRTDEVCSRGQDIEIRLGCPDESTFRESGEIRAIDLDHAACETSLFKRSLVEEMNIEISFRELGNEKAAELTGRRNLTIRSGAEKSSCRRAPHDQSIGVGA